MRNFIKCLSSFILIGLISTTVFSGSPKYGGTVIYLSSKIPSGNWNKAKVKKYTEVISPNSSAFIPRS